MSIQFSIQTAEKCAILSIEGRIMSEDGIAEIMDEVSKEITRGTKSWILDCSQLTYCNSTGLNMFIRILTKSRNVGGECVLLGVQPSVAKLFELSKLNEIFTSYTSKEEAIARFTTST